MDMVNVKVNGIAVSVPKGSTILEAARVAGVEIPTLCFLKDINEIGACRICVVEATGARGLVTACVYPVAEGMEISTNTEKVRKARRTTLEMILSTHEKKCLSCVRSGNCELQKLCHDYGVEESSFEGFNPHYELDTSCAHLVRNNNKCILCRRCVAACRQQFVSVIGANDRGIDTHIASAFEKDLADVPCISCGQCINVCPTGALTEQDDTQKVWDALSDPTKTVIVTTAPSVRAGLGECFGYPIGTNVEGQMVAALRRLGFDKVFDTNFAADLTIVEEANELVERIKNGGKLPMITSCSPGWVKFAEYFYPEQLDNLSTCKSPQQMAGAVIKTYYAEKAGIDPKNIVTVSVMPCTAKKFEAARPELGHDGMADVDYVITTRELARMIKQAGIDFAKLEDEDFDMLMGESTGASVIFGVTGGVMEAALRTAYEVLTGETLADVNFHAVRGMEGIKEATVKIGDLDVNVAVCSSTGKAAELLDSIKAGEKTYHFIEVMGCPGGCVNGGGQPIVSAQVRNWTDIRSERAKALYTEDESKVLRKSHENPEIKQIYAGFLGEPNSHKAHELLHTHYTKREMYSK